MSDPAVHKGCGGIIYPILSAVGVYWRCHKCKRFWFKPPIDERAHG